MENTEYYGQAKRMMTQKEMHNQILDVMWSLRAMVNLWPTLPRSEGEESPRINPDEHGLTRTAADIAADADEYVNGRCVGQPCITAKPRFSLLPTEALMQITDAFTFGAEKHKGDDFTKSDSGRTVEGEIDAVFRHICAYRCGCVADHETELHPLAHAAARLMIACQLAMEGRE